MATTEGAAADGRSQFKGHKAPTVSGGRRMVAAYLEEEDYVGLVGVAERRGASISSTLATAVRALVKRAK